MFDTEDWMRSYGTQALIEKREEIEERLSKKGLAMGGVWFLLDRKRTIDKILAERGK